MHKRSGVARKAVVPPAESCRGQWVQRTLSVSTYKNGTWPTTKQHLHRDSTHVAVALYNPQGPCSLNSKQSRRQITTRERTWAALRASILSGIPTITVPSFSQRPVGGLFLVTHSRRPGELPLAREDIPDDSFIAHVQHLRLARM